MRYTRGSRWKDRRRAAVVTALLLAVSCDTPDTEEGYNQFLDNTADMRAGETGSTIPDAGGGPISPGRYFMAINTLILPGAYLFFETTIELREATDGTVADITLQPLKTDLTIDGDPRPDPRTPAGAPFDVTDVPVVDGTFLADFGEVEVDAEGNPITFGLIVATLTLVGVALDDQTLCGDVQGDVSVPLPLPLEGATFGAVRHDGDFTELTDVFFSCPSDVGDAGGDDVGEDGGQDAGEDGGEDTADAGGEDVGPSDPPPDAGEEGDAPD